MQIVRLKDWPFNKDEVAKLLWIKSPYKNEDGEWIITLYFQSEDGDIRNIKTPWGSIPWLRFGQNFINGSPLEALKDGTLLTLNISNPSNGYPFKPVFLPDELIDTYKGINIEEENLWCFKLGGKMVFVPCIELVRAFLAPNVTLAKALLEPYGMSFIIESSSRSEDGISINLDKQVPKEIVTASFIKHLAWLNYNESAKELWSSILTEIFPDGAIEDSTPTLFDDRYSTHKNKTIIAWPPHTDESTWNIRAMQGDRFIYVFEIIGISGLEIPFRNITYQHDLIVQRKRKKIKGLQGYSKKPKQHRVKKTVAMTNSNPKTTSKPKIIRASATTISFKEDIRLFNNMKSIPVPVFEEMEKRPLNKRERRLQEIQLHQEKLLRERLDKEQNLNINIKLEISKRHVVYPLFSTAEKDFSSERNIKPVEFEGIRVADSQSRNGLDDFLKMIDVLATLNKAIKVLDIKIMTLPYGKSFSFMEDGMSRRFALVTLFYHNKTMYILEVERLTKIQLSTLLIYPKTGKVLPDKKLSVLLEGLLVGLINNYGHWDEDKLKISAGVIIKKIKHVESWTCLNWSFIIINNLNFWNSCD